MTTIEFVLLFIVPLVAMVATMFIVRAIKGPPRIIAGGTGWDDMHAEAYIGALVAGMAAVIAELLRGGPEIFVLIWNPLLTTVIVLPIAYAIALVIHASFGEKPQINN